MGTMENKLETTVVYYIIMVYYSILKPQTNSNHLAPPPLTVRQHIASLCLPGCDESTRGTKEPSKVKLWFSAEVFASRCPTPILTACCKKEVPCGYTRVRGTGTFVCPRCVWGSHLGAS